MVLKVDRGSRKRYELSMFIQLKKSEKCLLLPTKESEVLGTELSSTEKSCSHVPQGLNPRNHWVHDIQTCMTYKTAHRYRKKKRFINSHFKHQIPNQKRS